MLYPTNPQDPGRRRLIVVGVAIALLLVAFVTYTLLVNRSAKTSPGSAATAAQVDRVPATGTEPMSAELPKLTATSNPETFARQVVAVLFSWDTATLATRANHVEQLIDVADPTGQSTVGLASDLDNYLPTHDAWVDLTQYDTRQWLTVDSVTTPASWAQAEAQARDALLPGTTAYTIRGTRHRSGVWEGAPVDTAHQVSFTVFIVCAPSYPACHLLRLSMLDQPLD